MEAQRRSSRRAVRFCAAALAGLMLASPAVAVFAKGAGGAAGPAAERTRRNKVSADLRQSLSDSHDARRRRLGDSEMASVIMQLSGKPKGMLNAFLNRNGVHVNAKYEGLNALAVELPLSSLEELASFEEVSYVSADREMVSLGGRLSVEVGAEMVREQTSVDSVAYNLDGAGVGIAVLDSGLYSSHKSFTGRLGGSKDYTGENRTDDPFGHGTHVAAIAAGSASILSGRYSGVAPGATIYNLRVLNSQGVGRVSSVLAALNDLLLYHVNYNIRVVNMSLGMPAIDSYRDDPVCVAVRKLVDAGVVVVAAAGNNGKNAAGDKVYGLIHAPGNEPSAITVGASNDAGTVGRQDDCVTTFSSRGPTRSFWTDEAGQRHYDHVMKPDLVAPGNKIVSAESESNYLVRTNPTLDAGTSKFVNQKMMRLSGTSMATPVVAGAAALLLQLNPRLTPNMVKMILMYTSQQLAGFNQLEQGAGEVNVEGAVRLAKALRMLPAGTAVGTPMLLGPAPAPQTRISYVDSLGRAAATSFTWGQGVILSHTYATGAALINSYQAAYGLGVILGDGVIFSDGAIMGDGVVFSDGVIFADQIMTSAGAIMGDGAPFIGAGVVFGDGVVFSDGAIMGDGLIMSDSYIFGDLVTRGDYAAQSTSLLGGGDR